MFKGDTKEALVHECQMLCSGRFPTPDENIFEPEPPWNAEWYNEIDHPPAHMPAHCYENNVGDYYIVYEADNPRPDQPRWALGVVRTEPDPYSHTAFDPHPQPHRR